MPGARLCEFSSAELSITRYDLEAEVTVELPGAPGERIVMVARGELRLAGNDAPLGPGSWAVLAATAATAAAAGPAGASLVVTSPRR